MALPRGTHRESPRSRYQYSPRCSRDLPAVPHSCPSATLFGCGGEMIVRPQHLNAYEFVAVIAVRLGDFTSRARGLAATWWTRLDSRAETAVDCRGAEQQRSTTFEGLQHVLRLAALCPSGAAGDEIRRGACELIEAESHSRQLTCRARILKSLARALSRASRGRARTDDPSPLLLKQLVEAVRSGARSD